MQMQYLYLTQHYHYRVLYSWGGGIGVACVVVAQVVGKDDEIGGLGNCG